MISFRPAAIVMALALLSASPASAQTTVFSTFGPGDLYAESVGRAVNMNSFAGSRFTYTGPSGDLLFGLRFAAFGGAASGADLRVSFWEGVSMNSATQLESWTGFVLPDRSSTIFSVTSLTNPVLTTGANYWVMLSATTLQYAWNFASEGTGREANSNDGGASWFEVDNLPLAFDVQTVPPGTPGEVVPEPATMTLLATGLLGLGAARRKRRLRQG